jgi:hypothetical protein
MANRELVPERTARHMRQEVLESQERRYCGRPLAIQMTGERAAVGSKINEGLRRHYAR